MSQLVWDQPGTRRFEAGVDRGVLYPVSGPGVAWNGLVSVDEKPSGGEASAYYMDGVKIRDSIAHEDYEATLKAFTYPDEFLPCEGISRFSFGMYATQQPKQRFGLSYRTLIGNDIEGTDHAYRIHFVYNAMAESSDKNQQTLDNSASAEPFQWALHASPPNFSMDIPTAHFYVDSVNLPQYAIDAIESAIYGTSSSNPYLPLPSDIADLLNVGGVITEPLSEPL